MNFYLKFKEGKMPLRVFPRADKLRFPPSLLKPNRHVIMRINLIMVILMTVLMQVNARSFAQRVTMHEDNASLEVLFEKLNRQTGYDFVYNPQMLKEARPININVRNARVKDVLDQIFRDQPLTYTLDQQVIIVKRKKKPVFSEEAIPRRQQSVTGRITDKDGNPLPGATVQIKGSTRATSTDAGGNYSIQASPGTVLVYSMVGFTKVERTVEGSGPIHVVLEEDMNVLRDVKVVSTGYQKLDRKLFTGSVTTLQAQDVERNGVPDISRMLEGQVAGASIQNVSGTFGAAPKIRIRGATSLSGDNKPLWVVDGIILEDIVNISNEALSTGDANTLIGSSVAGLNPNDIESFTILKDAAATALYGARAMNGVIVVTTKKGAQTEGKPRINYSGNFTTYLKPSYSTFDILNSSEQMGVLIELENKGFYNHSAISRAADGGIFYKMYNKMYQYDPETETFALRNDLQSRMDFLERYAAVNTDWFDVLFRNSLMHEHSLSFSSGTAKSQTYASASFLGDNGWSLGDNVKRYTGNIRNNFRLSDRFSGEIMAQGSIRDQTAPGTLGRTSDPVYGEYSRDFDINPFSYALNTSRTMSAYDDEGNLEYFTRNYAPFNIINEVNNNYLNLTMIDFKMQLGMEYKILDNLTYSFDGAYRYAKTQRQHYILENSNMAMAYRTMTDATVIENNKFLYRDPDYPNEAPISVLPEGGFYNTTDDNLKNYYLRNNLEYNTTFNTDHLLNVFASMELGYTDRQHDNFDGVAYQYGNGGIVNPDFKYFKWIQEAGYPYYGMYYRYDRFMAYMLRGAYSYQGKYSFNATTRYDGSNRMGSSKTARWLPTWNVSGAWNIDKEPFFQENPYLDYATLRATYGLVGNMGNAANSSAIFYNQVTRRPYPSEKETAIYISNLENSELTWEKMKEFNLGVDLGFADGRVDLTVDLYKRDIYDLIGRIRTSGIGGEFTKAANYGNMSGKGIEVTLAGTVIDGKDWKWRTNFNFGYNKTEITSLKVNPNIWELVRAEGGTLEGHPQRGLYSIQFDGLNHEYGYPTYIGETGEKTPYVYLQSDDVDYLTYEGPVDPPFNGGFYNQLRYKNFTLSALFTFSAGNVIRMNPVYSSSYSDMYAMTRDMLNRWTMPGDEQFTNVPSIMDAYSNDRVIKDPNGSTIGAVYPYNLYNYSTERVAKGDFIRLKQVSLGYELPERIASFLQMSNAQIVLVGNNLALLYSDKRLNGQDPEFFGNGGVALPIPRQLTVSLKLGF